VPRRPTLPTFDRPEIVAHRGGARLAPENTLAAFDGAASIGVDAIELDVRLSRDGVPVVLHDAEVDRTTDRSGFASRWTARELAAFDAGCRFVRDGRHPWRDRGLGIPRLSEVLARYPTMRLIVELKGRDPGIGRAVVEEIARAGASERVCLGGFTLRVMRAARACLPRLPSGAARLETRVALYRSRLGWPLGRPAYQVFQVPERVRATRIVSPAFIEAAHRAGLPVYVWTVDDPADMRRLLAWGVDGIITDRPDVALEVRDEFLHCRSRLPD
jgi:glycerophosphoryl diester phosphodiesterase